MCGPPDSRAAHEADCAVRPLGAQLEVRGRREAGQRLVEVEEEHRSLSDSSASGPAAS